MIKSVIFLVVCFTLSLAQEEADPLLPSCDVDLIEFLFMSKDEPPFEIIYNDTDSLSCSGIIPGAPTILLIDGFLSNASNSLMTANLVKTLLAQPEVRNIISINWGALSGGDTGILDFNTLAALTMFPLVLLNVPPTGQRVADFLQFLHLNADIPQSEVWIIGHSLGAHIAGCAGYSSKADHNATIHRLTGLDPGGPLYYLSLSDDDMISKSNAAWVDLYHSGRGGMGDSRTNSGNIDVFINGGNSQPGCTFPSPSDPVRYCDHSYCWKYFNNTITANPPVTGCPCLPGGLFPTCFCQGSNCGGVANCWNSRNMGYNAVYGSNGFFYAADANTYQ